PNPVDLTATIIAPVTGAVPARRDTASAVRYSPPIANGIAASATRHAGRRTLGTSATIASGTTAAAASPVPKQDPPTRRAPPHARTGRTAGTPSAAAVKRAASQSTRSISDVPRTWP